MPERDAPLAGAQLAVLRAVAQLPPQHALRRRYRIAIPFADPLFPPDDHLQSAPGAPQDAALAAWLALPRSARAHDVLVTPDEDYYWQQEGRQYRAQFIVHLAPAARPRSGDGGGQAADGASGRHGAAGRGAGGVVLHVLQVHATHRLGRRFHMLGRTGPGWYWELRPAPPSAPAAADLTAFLRPALGPWLQGSAAAAPEGQ